MSLRQTAALDLKNILGDKTSGFGWPITLTSPDGLAVPLTGFSTDIGVALDPDTGQVVSGRTASAALIMSDIVGGGFTSQPVGVVDDGLKPWLVTFDDINGVAYTFKVSRDIPDNATGVVVLILELYNQ